MQHIRIDRAKSLADDPATGHNRWHPDIPPLVEADEGEQVVLETRDASDGFVVRGTDAPLQGLVEVHDDHRIAMAFGVLAATKNTEIHLDDLECVAVSYPGFWGDLDRVTA